MPFWPTLPRRTLWKLLGHGTFEPRSSQFSARLKFGGTMFFFFFDGLLNIPCLGMNCLNLGLGEVA